MVAYSYKPGFVPAIQARIKQQTIRLPRKRHARVGEALQLFTGPRMSPLRLGAAVCHRVGECRLDFQQHQVELDGFLQIAGDDELNAFATRDGFGESRSGLTPWEFMSRWWAMTHPGQPVFAGVLIDWSDSFVAAPK